MLPAFGPAIIRFHMEGLPLGRSMNFSVDEEIVGDEAVVSDESFPVFGEGVESGPEWALVEEQPAVVLVGVLSVGLAVEGGHRRQLAFGQRPLNEF